MTTPTTFRLAFLGFGNVGRALARLLLRKQALLAAQGVAFTITGISTGRHGAAIHPHGLALERALALVEAGQPLDELSALPAAGLSTREFLAASRAQALFESIPVNYETGQPALDALRAALELGMHAISANKGPVVHAYRSLRATARAHGVEYLFESAVMDGAPIFSLFRHTLPAIELRAFCGLLNSTTNLILTRMEGGETFAQAVAYAQSIGIAETDPSGDVDGWDAAVKVAALATVLMDTPLLPAQVERQGIRAITPEMVRQAAAHGERWKLVCRAERAAQGVTARVAPERVGADSPFYGVSGTSSIIQFETDILPALSVVEGNPGPETTAYGMLADFLRAIHPAPSFE